MSYRCCMPVFAIAAVLGSVAWSQTRPQELVAYWPLDEGEGDVARDGSGRGHDLRLQDVRWVDGAVGRGLGFRGPVSKAHTPLTDALRPSDQVTVEAWTRVDDLSGRAEGIGIVNAGTSYLLRFSGPVPSFHIFTDGWGPVRADGAVRPGRWYHLVGTYDGKAMRIYVNGRLAGARHRTGAIRRADEALSLGRQVNALNGCIDEVKIYRRALGAEEVAASFAAARAKLNPGVTVGSLIEPFEDLFGPTRSRAEPAATLGHLAKADLCFAVITDTHIGQVGEEGRYCHHWRVEETIRQLNALRPDFVVHCGDIITTFPFSPAFEDQCRNAVKMLGKFKMPVHLVPGNHDIGNQRNMRVWDKKWLKRINSRPLEAMLFKPAYREVYRKYFGDDYYGFEAGGCRFIVMDNQICNSGGPLEGTQTQWLEAELGKARDAKASFLFMHNPLFWHRPDEPGPKNYEPVLNRARGRLLAMLGRCPVTAVYAGHTHFAFANTYQGIWMRTINSTTFNRNYRGVEQHMPGEAQIYDPYKLGYLIVRVRGRSVHESWVPLYRPVREPPGELGRIAGPRLVARPATEVADSVLGITARPPSSISHDPKGRELINDHWWRAAEDLGSKWLQVWPPPRGDRAWTDLARGLTIGRPRGVHVAVALPHKTADMTEACARLSGYRDAVAAVLVPNGAPDDANAPLSTWRPTGDPDDWSKACARIAKLRPAGAKVVLARLPLAGKDALNRIRETVGCLAGKADALAVWLATQSRPEIFADRIASAAEIARARGLELWLDVAAWQRIDEPRRSAYLLRLLAVCQAQKVRVFWWVGPDDAGGLIDRHWDPTPTFYAAQAWQAMVDGPAQPVTVNVGDTVRLDWQDGLERKYTVWWRLSDDTTVHTVQAMPDLPGKPIVVDPLHGRLLKLSSSTKVPVCGWPLIARGE